MGEYIYERPEQPAKVVRDGWNVRIEWDFVQREEIVRCRDCKEFRDSDFTCHAWQWHNWETAIEVDPDGFCSYGERRENA